MMWQDLVFTIGGFSFFISMIPTLRSKYNKPEKSSCAITASFLWLYCFVYASLGLWMSVCSGILSATGWTVLFFQNRIKQ